MRTPLQLQTSAGGVIVRRRPTADTFGSYEVCLVLRDRHHRRAWCLPKGHFEQGEDAQAAARREVQEETGLVGEILRPLGSVTYEFSQPGQRGRCRKTVFFFLMRAIGGRLGAHDTQETVEARWVPLDEASSCATYENEQRVLAEARRLLTEAAVARRIDDARGT
jgi:ADP-ribose pyrophosphatase YjhB (NUDIX family)